MFAVSRGSVTKAGVVLSTSRFFISYRRQKEDVGNKRELKESVMRLIVVEEKDIVALIEKLKLEKFQIKKDSHQSPVEEIHRRFHYVVCSWVQEHGSDYLNG